MFAAAELTLAGCHLMKAAAFTRLLLWCRVLKWHMDMHCMLHVPPARVSNGVMAYEYALCLCVRMHGTCIMRAAQKFSNLLLTFPC